MVLIQVSGIEEIRIEGGPRPLILHDASSSIQTYMASTHTLQHSVGVERQCQAEGEGGRVEAGRQAGGMYVGRVICVMYRTDSACVGKMAGEDASFLVYVCSLARFTEPVIRPSS